jgi:hypothetical protein
MRPQIDEMVREDVILVIKELCAPDFRLRGHRRGIGRNDQYSLQRYVSQFNLLRTKTEIGLRLKRAS